MAWTKRTGIMLCQPLDEHNLDRNLKMCPYLFAQPKLDGMRAWVDWQGEDPLLISSQGNVIEELPHINMALKLLSSHCGVRPNFDGELYRHGMEFEQILSRTKRTAERHEDYLGVQYHIFDLKSEKTQLEREQTLTDTLGEWRRVCEPLVASILCKVPTFTIKRDRIEELLDTFLTQGYEGIILRNPLAPYVEKRPFTILKWKPSKKDWYRIVGYEEAYSEMGKPLNRLGALLCEDRWGNRFKVGPGLGITHEKATSLLALGDDLLNKYAEVYYQNLTTNGVPRFGKFKLLVDATTINGELS